jgi:hypothetical protein
MYLNEADGLNCVTFFPDSDAGMRDVPTTAKYGKWLTKYHASRLNEDEIKTWASYYHSGRKTAQIKWATTKEEIQEVYERCEGREGVRSCMTKVVQNWSLMDKKGELMHPTWAYESPDIRVAYIENEKGSILARALVVQLEDRPPHWVRIYGDYQLMETALHKQHVISQGSLAGARLKVFHLDSPNKIVCPFLDGDITYITAPKPNDEFMRVGQAEGGHRMNHPAHNIAFLTLPKMCHFCNEHEAIYFNDHIHYLPYGAGACGECITGNSDIVRWIDGTGSETLAYRLGMPLTRYTTQQRLFGCSPQHWNS